MTTDINAKSAARAKLKLVAAHTEAALEGLYGHQPGARQLLPMLAELKEMRRNLAEDWSADADVDGCRQIWLRVVEFDKAIASIQRLLDLGSPIG
jgi:hypothetical protein